jgi:hypothetical protein
LRTYAEPAWAVAFLLFGGLLCFVPLFDVLSYEWCVAMGVVAAVAGAVRGAIYITRQRRSGGVLGDTGVTVARLYATVVARLWRLLVLPLAAIVANAARVRNCDLAAGFAWFALLPLVSGAVGAALGVVVGLVRPWQRALWPSLLALAGIACSIVWGFVSFYRTPPCFAYDPFVGYVPGPLYDEDVGIAGALIWARVYHVAVATTALGACALFLDGTTLAIRARAARGRKALLAFVLAAASLAVVLFGLRAHLGIALDADDVARALGAERRTEHLVLHYSSTGPYASKIDDFAADFEFRWAQHARLFPRSPATPVHAFLFDSPTQKRVLIGASNTLVTKGWRRETYLHYEGWPQSSLSHELAHVFASSFGDRFFGGSFDGLRSNIGLMEGVAVAAEWSSWKPLTPHQAVKLLRETKLVGDDALARVMGPGFYGLPGGQAYAIAGSFCRFLLDTRGAYKLMEILHAGGDGEAWRRIYGVDFGALDAEWRRLVDAQVVANRDRELALDWLGQPSVFGRPCAHAAALERRQAAEAMRAGDARAALASWQAVCDGGLADPDDLADASEAALAADDPRAARRFASELLARADIRGALRGKAEIAVADAALLDGDVGAAAVAYERAAQLPMNDWRARMLAIKRPLCDWPAGPARTTMARVLVIAERESEPSFDLGSLRALVAQEPHRALYGYVLTRQLMARGRFREALDTLTSAEPLPDGQLERDRRRVEGESAFHLGQYGRAREIFDNLAQDPDASVGLARDALDWRDRCDFALSTRAD